MIIIKSSKAISLMRQAGRIAARARELGGSLVTEGVTTMQIDMEIRKFIEKSDARPSFLKYNGFPASSCISVNDEVIHGIPSKRILKNGDIVKIDVGANYKGYHGDCAATFAVGDISNQAKRLIKITEESFFNALKVMRCGYRVGDIGDAVDSYATAYGYSTVKDYTGHGIGERLHEEPEVPNFGIKGRGARLQPGMTIAVEPMINEGTWNIRISESDKWTVYTTDGKLSAHFENTVLITDAEPVILTDLN